MRFENVIEVIIDKEADIIIINTNTTRVILVNILANLVFPNKGHNPLLHKGKSYFSCAIAKLSTKTVKKCLRN